MLSQGLDTSPVKLTAVACWRAHMNALVKYSHNLFSFFRGYADDWTFKK